MRTHGEQWPWYNRGHCLVGGLCMGTNTRGSTALESQGGARESGRLEPRPETNPWQPLRFDLAIASDVAPRLEKSGCPTQISGCTGESSATWCRRSKAKTHQGEALPITQSTRQSVEGRMVASLAPGTCTLSGISTPEASASAPTRVSETVSRPVTNGPLPRGDGPTQT